MGPRRHVGNGRADTRPGLSGVTLPEITLLEITIWAAAGLALMALCLAPRDAVAQDSLPSEPPAWAYGIAHELMSPFCPGRTLAECPSPQADELRLWILTQAAAGASVEEVEDSLIARFGDQILGAPRAEGWGIAAYAFPFGGFVLGGIFAVWLIRRMVAPSGAPDAGEARAAGPAMATRGPAPSASDADLERLLDEELGRG